jgi:AcrR family transcriptional regulator
MENDARRAQLITLALGVFSVNAYDEVSMDDVARAAGISKGLVYHYFPTKRHFYVAALREAARQLLEQTTPQDELAPADRLREGLEAYLSFVEKHARAYTTLLRGGIGVDKEVNVIVEATRSAFVDRFFFAWKGTVGAPAVTPTLRLGVRGWIGFVEATALDWLERKRELSRGALVDMWIMILVTITQSAQ